MDAQGDHASKDLVIYGNGAMARVVYSYIEESRHVAAFTVDDDCIGDATDRFCGRPLVPFSKIASDFPPERFDMLVVVGYARMNRLRQERCGQARGMGYELASYVHPSVFLKNVEIGENCIVLDHVAIHCGSVIGAGSFLSSNVSIGHDCAIGEMCWINAGVGIGGGTRIGSRTFLGINATIGHGIVIGEANYISANALLTRPTDDDAVYIASGAEKFRLGSEAFLRFTGQ